ncbi:MAG: TVP38/TMEM64 family protein [Firmicutes bacterium]|nr:TVP38/TMEM64 family protein [Bacillota bacterium]
MLMNLYDIIITTINEIGIFGPLLGSILIIFESILPVMPLFVFITLNFIAFGNLLGFFISWICTVVGCLLSYYLVKSYFSEYVYEKFHNDSIFQKFYNYLNTLNIQNITVILAIPFTPAFIINIVAGLVNYPFLKFLIAILISKIFLVYFWGYIGTGLVESLHNPESLIYVGIMLLLAYIFSIITKKVLKL